MKVKLILFSTLFLFIIKSNGQINPKTKWGNVSQAEIDYKEVPFEKEAPAVILYEDGKTSISGTFQNYVYRRIKILNEKGIEFANQELLYYSYKNLERFVTIKAQTINIENGSVKIYPVDKNSIFDVNVNEYYSSKKFTFPNVKVGSIIEFEYSMQDDKLYLIDAWRFQHEIPTLYSNYKASNNSSLDYASLLIGDRIVKNYEKKSSNNLSEWTLTNLPSFRTLSFLYNPEDMAERIAFQLRGYYGRNGSAFGGSTYKDAIMNWKDLSKEMEDSYRTYTNESYGRNIANSIPDGKDEKETLLNIYNYFKQNYKWNHFTAIHPKISNRELDKERRGNAADLNLMLNTLLKIKGFDAKMVLLSTRNNGKIITSYPYLGQFNMVINLVTLKNGSTYLIDATDLNHDLGYMPLRNYNHFGLVVNANEEKFINLYQPVSEYHSTQTYTFKNGVVNLVRTDKKNGYLKIKNQELPEGIAEYNPVENSLDLLMNEKKKETKDPDSESDYELIRTSFDSNGILTNSFVAVENPLKSIVAQYKFEEKTRERVLEFNFPIYYKTDVIVTIPDGYSAEVLPDFKSHNEIKSKELIYLQNAEITDGKLILHVEFYMGKAIFANSYSEIKSFFEKSNLDASKTILLKKS